jgi:metal-responsive CopG/Arc/MetJ family transcriptional regulator
VGRREVLVQLDDELVEGLDRVAKELGISRSELLRRAAAALLEAEALRQADRELQEAYRRVPQDPEWVEALTSLAAASLPEW